MSKFKNGPKVLLIDIETAPLLSHTWGLWDQNVGLNQIDKDWHLLSWSAKWLGDPASKIMYQDQSTARDMENDTKILRSIWKLLDEADIVISQNGKKFDTKKLNARFVIAGLKPPSNYKQIDTLVIAKRVFGFTSNKLEYMTEKLCKKYKKLKHKKFAGFDLWKECLARNKEAWKEMEKYNKHDVLALEELYYVLQPWDNSLNFNLYRSSEDHVCNCGGSSFTSRGYAYTSVGKYQRFVCNDCGAWSRSGLNMLTVEDRKDLSRRIT